MTTPANLSLLPYTSQRAVALAYAATGRLVFIHRSRQGNVRISLNGGRYVCVADALAQMERALTTTQSWDVAHAAHAAAETARIARMRDRLAGAVALTVGGEG